MSVPNWLERIGRETVVASRVRIARNVMGTAFRGTVAPQEGRRFCERVLEALKGRHPAFAPLADETSENAAELAGILRIPANFVSGDDPGPWLALEDSGRGALVLDGDHLRLWSVRPGSALAEALEEAGRLEQVAGAILPFCKDSDRGWLTSSPMDAGTGMRASLLLHLPALWASSRMNGVPDAMEAMSHSLRSPWGGSVSGDDAGLVLVTHHGAFGRSEADAILGLVRMATILETHETQARQALLDERAEELEDAVSRSVAVLASARLLSRRELSARTRWISLGARLGWVDPRIAQAAMEAHLRTDDHSLLSRIKGPPEEFVDGLERMRARLTAPLVRQVTGA
ncbi:MAG TPA: hypothetical protein PKO15_07810 [Fibrobacteria bacterium]|nr:hypothetical protein [Fibrobacteria bacterium]HOX52308.1 hypothetical protein [Fibrobacteria bacterium]